MQEKEWAIELKRESDEDNYPNWPNEIMLKVLFGKYLKNNFILKNNAKVIDIGCFFGNNLFPFAFKGAQCYGIDIHDDIIKKANLIFKKKGYIGQFKKGNNTSIPYADNTFDLLLSINTIHYEPSRESVEKALSEFKRVLKPKGRVFICTVGSNHDIRKKAIKLDDNTYKIKDWDFRDGQTLHFFENKNTFKKTLSKYFYKVEVGEVTEQIMSKTLGFFIGSAVR